MYSTHKDFVINIYLDAYNSGQVMLSCQIQCDVTYHIDWEQNLCPTESCYLSLPGMGRHVSVAELDSGTPIAMSCVQQIIWNIYMGVTVYPMEYT